MSPAFAYRAVDATGKRIRGNLEAASSATVVGALERRGLVVLEVRSASHQGSSEAGAAARSLGRRRSALELTRALAALLSAGMPLPKALAAAGHVTAGRTALALEAVRSRVERGEGLAAALAADPDLFPPVYVGLVRAGEKSGDLAAAFRRLAEQLERQEALRARLVSAAIYPLILAILGGLAVVVLLVFVIPRFVDLLEGAGATLPSSTALLLAISGALSRSWFLLPLFATVLLLTAISGRGTDRGRRVAASFLARPPLVRTLRKDLLAGRFARLTGVLLGGGAPLLAALEDVEASISDPLSRDAVGRMRRRIREGASLHMAIDESGFFPALLGQLVAVGEESGRLQEFLLKAAEIFEERTDRLVQRLVTLAEPAMILLFGGIVAFVALSLLQAIYGVNAGAFR